MSMKISSLNATLLGLCCAFALSACGGSSSNNTGSANFAVTDAPVDDIDIVKISFSRIDFKPAGDAELVSVNFDQPVIIDNLLALSGNVAQTIAADVELGAGDYSWLRLYVDGGFPNSTVTPTLGNETDLFIPGQQNGNPNGPARFLQLNTGFTVPTAGSADFTIDFDLRKGLTKPRNADYYLLRPAMRLVNNVEVGSITGTVESTVINHPACSSDDGPVGLSVYLYLGDLIAGGLSPDDIYDPGIASGSDEVQETSGVRPVASAEVSQNDSGGYSFTLGFIAERSDGYSLAFSCESHLDFADTDDDIAFTEVQAVYVSAGESSELHFSAAPATDTSL